MVRARIFTCAVLSVFIILSGCAEIDALLQDLPTGSDAPLDEGTIVAGLKEALEIGTKNAADSLSAEGAFLMSEVFRIPLPEELDDVGKRLRQLGLGSQVDDFIESMNHAAEKAAGEAVDVFVGAIREMTFADARGILQGPDNAATMYFEEKTRPVLYGRFYPVADSAMDSVGVTKLYGTIMDTYSKIPLVKKKTFDLNEYITDRALDALFIRVAEEEKEIRTDPVARVTETLKRVFGNR